MKKKLFNPSLENLKMGVPMTLCLFEACMALWNIVEFATGTLIPDTVSVVLQQVLTAAVILSFVGTPLVWWLFGDHLIERLKNVGWLVGFYYGIPAAVLVSFASGFVQKLNRTQAWMDEDLMFRIGRMISSSIIPLCALIGYVWFAIKRRTQGK